MAQRGYSRGDAVILANRLIDPEARCEICGIYNKVLWAMYKEGYLFPWGRREQNRRLTPDNLKPGRRHTLINTRLLCLGCNAYRGPAARTDEQVLVWAREQWRLRLAEKFLWWLR